MKSEEDEDMREDDEESFTDSLFLETKCNICMGVSRAEEGDQDDAKLSSSIVKWLQTGHTCPCIATLCPLTAA